MLAEVVLGLDFKVAYIATGGVGFQCSAAALIRPEGGLQGMLAWTAYTAVA